MLFLWSSQWKEAYCDFIMYTSTFWEHNVLRDIQWDEKESTYFGEQKTSTHTNWCLWGMPPTCLHGTEPTLRLSIGNCVSELKGKSEHLGAVGFCLNGAGRRHLQRGGGDHSWENWVSSKAEQFVKSCKVDHVAKWRRWDRWKWKRSTELSFDGSISNHGASVCSCFVQCLGLV